MLNVMLPELVGAIYFVLFLLITTPYLYFKARGGDKARKKKNDESLLWSEDNERSSS